MKMFSDCSGPCKTCKTFYVGMCMAGHGDDEYTHATPEWIAKLKPPCAVCGVARPGRYDPCLGRLWGVKAACCGHGIEEEAYFHFITGLSLRGKEALRLQRIWINNNNITPDNTIKIFLYYEDLDKTERVCKLTNYGWTGDYLIEALMNAKAEELARLLGI